VARRRLIGCADGFRLVAPRTDCPFRAGRARPSAAQNDAAASKSTGAQNRRYALVWVARAVADGTEEDLYELWHDLEEGRQARIATVIFGSDAGVDDVKRIGAAQNRLVHEVKRRRSLPERIAALKADDGSDRVLPEDTRPRVASVAEQPKRPFPYGRRGWRQV
jgi:hypothetical protein